MVILLDVQVLIPVLHTMSYVLEFHSGCIQEYPVHTISETTFDQVVYFDLLQGYMTIARMG